MRPLLSRVQSRRAPSCSPLHASYLALKKKAVRFFFHFSPLHSSLPSKRAERLPIFLSSRGFSLQSSTASRPESFEIFRRLCFPIPYPLGLLVPRRRSGPTVSLSPFLCCCRLDVNETLLRFHFAYVMAVFASVKFCSPAHPLYYHPVPLSIFR